MLKTVPDVLDINIYVKNCSRCPGHPIWLTVADVLGMFQLLGDHGMDFNSSMDTDGCSALITAITLDWPIVVQLLVDLGVDVHDEGMPKFGASVSSDLALVSEEEGAAGDHRGAGHARDQNRFIFSKGCSQYVSPLLCATMLRRHAIVDTLLSAGADYQQTSLGSFWKSSTIGACSVCDVRVSPLHIAAYHGDVDLLRRLLDTCRARCVERNSDTGRAVAASAASAEEDITPLWLALLRGETAAVKVLLEFEHPRAPPCHFGSGLYVSLEADDYDNARLLLRAGYDLWEDLEWIESELFPTVDKDIIEFIKSFTSEPPSLLVCSRNVLRRHMGLRLPAYLSTVKIPQKVADAILLKDVLSSDEPASADDVTVSL